MPGVIDWLIFPSTFEGKFREGEGRLRRLSLLNLVKHGAIGKKAQEPYGTCDSLSPHVKGVRIPESGKILLMECGILGFGIRNTGQGIWIPTNDWNPESRF